MNVNLLYTLPEEKQELLRALKATNAYLVVYDMFQELRKVWKYSELEDEIAFAEHWRDKLIEICSFNGVNVDEELS